MKRKGLLSLKMRGHQVDQSDRIVIHPAVNEHSRWLVKNEQIVVFEQNLKLRIEHYPRLAMLRVPSSPNCMMGTFIAFNMVMKRFEMGSSS